MLPENTRLAAALVDKYSPRFAKHLRIDAEMDSRLRCLIDLLVCEAMFAERWGDLVDPNMIGETTPQLRLWDDDDTTAVASSDGEQGLGRVPWCARRDRDASS